MHPHSLGHEGLPCSSALTWCFLSCSRSTGEATSAPLSLCFSCMHRRAQQGPGRTRPWISGPQSMVFFAVWLSLAVSLPTHPHEGTWSIHKAPRDVLLKAVQHPNTHQTAGSCGHYGGQKAEHGDESSSDAVKVHVCTRGEGILLQQPQQLLGRHRTVYQLPTLMQALELLTHLSISSLCASQELHVCVQGTWGESRKRKDVS